MQPSSINWSLNRKNRTFIIIRLLYYKITPSTLLTIPLQMLLNTVSCRPNVAFDHIFDQLLVWFVYIRDCPLLFQQPSDLSREHIPLKGKALRRQECFDDCLRELDKVRGG